jgi:YHS domain-containing protein
MATMVGPTKQLTRDPVCGMRVDPEKALSVDHNGEKFYFCSLACIIRETAEEWSWGRETAAKILSAP